MTGTKKMQVSKKNCLMGCSSCKFALVYINRINTESSIFRALLQVHNYSELVKIFGMPKF